MKKLIIFLCAVIPVVAFSTNPKEKFPSENIANAEIGQVVQLTQLVVSNQAGDADYYAKGIITLPLGFDILRAEPLIISHDEGQFTIEEVTQPGYVALPSSVADNIREIKNLLKDGDYEDGDYNNIKVMIALNNISVSLDLAKVLDTKTPPQIKWRAHAEGHKYKGDGHIKAAIKYELLRVPTADDYQLIILELAEVFLDSSQEDLAEELSVIIDKLKKLVGSSENHEGTRVSAGKKLPEKIKF